MDSDSNIIFKVVSADQWTIAQKQGEFRGAEIDLTDGYIHFSTAQQVEATVEKHFAGQPGLILVGVDSEKLGDALKYEPSRGGDLFPHLYGSLNLEAVVSVAELPIGKDGKHIFPS